LYIIIILYTSYLILSTTITKK